MLFFSRFSLIYKKKTEKGNGQRATGNGQRATGNGQRATGNGQRATGNGQRATGNGLFKEKTIKKQRKSFAFITRNCFFFFF